MPDIVVPENIAGAGMDELRREFDVAFEPDLWKDSGRLKQQLQAAKGLIVRNETRVTAELLSSASALQVIGRAGAGVDNIDVPAASAAGIVVVYAPRENSVSVAELALGFMLAWARHIPRADHDTHHGGWNRRRFIGTELFGKTLGIVGLGRIGTLTAERAKAFGMRIIAHDACLSRDAPQLVELDAALLSLDQLLAEADIVSCHVPLSDETRGMFDYQRFCQMKPSALFVNTSRGEVVNEQGLVRALREQRIAGAALDVRLGEPPEPGPLEELENVILTPHIAAFTQEAQQRVVAAVCRDVSAVLRGEGATNYFNFDRPRR